MPSRASNSGGGGQGGPERGLRAQPEQRVAPGLVQGPCEDLPGAAPDRPGDGRNRAGAIRMPLHRHRTGWHEPVRLADRRAGDVLPASGFGEGPGWPVVAGRVGSPGGGDLLLTPRACAGSTMVGVSVASHGEPSVDPWLCRGGPGSGGGAPVAFPSPRKEHHRGRSAGHWSHRWAAPKPGRVVGDELAVRTEGVAAIHWVECGVAVTPVAWGNALPRGWFRCGLLRKRKLDEEVLLWPARPQHSTPTSHPTEEIP